MVWKRSLYEVNINDSVIFTSGRSTHAQGETVQRGEEWHWC